MFDQAELTAETLEVLAAMEETKRFLSKLNLREEDIKSLKEAVIVALLDTEGDLDFAEACAVLSALNDYDY